MPDDQIPLERGLTFFFNHEAEFKSREIPIEKQVALAFEAGLQMGRHEFETERPVNIFKPKEWKS